MKCAVVMYAECDGVRLTRTVDAPNGDVEAAIVKAVLEVEEEGVYDRRDIVIADVIDPNLCGQGDGFGETISSALDWPALGGEEDGEEE